MSFTYHSNIINNVNRISKNQLVSECLLLSTGCEATARIKVSTVTFVIEEAEWEIYRSPNSELNGAAKVSELSGAEAYFQAGKVLKVVGEKYGELPRELLAECVRGVIQAETYVFEDRGFPSAEVFEADWTQNYLNSCRLYSNIELLEQSWFDFIDNRKWGDSLFNRYKFTSLQAQEDGSILATASFVDSFHELGIKFIVKDDIIGKVTGNFMRVPDSICRGNVEHIAKFEGLAVASLNKKEIGKRAGGSQGCSHLVDLLVHTVSTLQQAGREL